MSAPDRRSLLANVALALGVLAFGACAMELGLRLTGFRWVLYPEEIEFGKPDPVLMKTGFEPDDETFWVPPGYEEKLARLRHDPPALVLQGDSCTQLGHYDERLAELVGRRTGAELPVANLGVAGWSSHQGLAQLRRDVVPLRPEVVTVYFGWNDHWIGFGVEDRTVAAIRRVFSSRWSRLRLVQLATKAWVAAKAGREGAPNRVSPADFRENLSQMVRVARESGIRPMLLTAPSNHRRGEEPEYLGSRWLRDVAELVPLHQRYVAIVREVARDTDAALCDLEAAIAGLDAPERSALFLPDGIHLTDRGDRAVAALLLRCLEREGWLDLLIGGRADRVPGDPGLEDPAQDPDPPS